MKISLQKHHDEGFTLIEALIALLVATVGLIGLAALHLSALKNAHSSYYRSISSTIALDFEERLWAYTAINANAGLECIEESAIDTIIADLTNDWEINGLPSSSGWNWTDVARAGIPGLEIDFGYTISSITRPYDGGGNWLDQAVNIPLQIQWSDDRFGDEGEPVEQFDYVVRIPCVPEFQPPS